MSEKACDGGRVLEAWHEMAECIECGTCVRWDLQDHPFFGFQHCSKRPQAINAVDPSAQLSGTPTPRGSSSLNPPPTDREPV